MFSCCSQKEFIRMYQRDYLVKLHYRQAPRTFIKCIRESFHYMDDNLFSLNVKNLSEINNIQDISPNWKKIEYYIRHAENTNRAVFLAALCCFFDNSIGSTLLDALDCTTIRDIADYLDYNQLTIITKLMLNYL